MSSQCNHVPKAWTIWEKWGSFSACAPRRLCCLRECRSPEDIPRGWSIDRAEAEWERLIRSFSRAPPRRDAMRIPWRPIKQRRTPPKVANWIGLRHRFRVSQGTVKHLQAQTLASFLGSWRRIPTGFEDATRNAVYVIRRRAIPTDNACIMTGFVMRLVERTPTRPRFAQIFETSLRATHAMRIARN